MRLAVNGPGRHNSGAGSSDSGINAIDIEKQGDEMMNYKISLPIICLVLLLITAACAPSIQRATEASSERGTVEYARISAKEASEMMKNQNAVILDVRTEKEFSSGAIPGALLLPVDDIQERAEQVLPDKKVPILIYCRSGNRSRTASLYLIQLGYTSVYDFGGILDWPYEIE